MMPAAPSMLMPMMGMAGLPQGMPQMLMPAPGAGWAGPFIPVAAPMPMAPVRTGGRAGYVDLDAQVHPVMTSRPVISYGEL